MILFHGTHLKFSTFDQGCFFTPSIAIAEEYARLRVSNGGRVIACEVRLGKVLRLTWQELAHMMCRESTPFEWFDTWDGVKYCLGWKDVDFAVRRRLRLGGYDTAHMVDIDDIGGVQDQYVIINPGDVRMIDEYVLP